MYAATKRNSRAAHLTCWCAGSLLLAMATFTCTSAMAKESGAVLNVSTKQAQGTTETTMQRIVLGYEDVVLVVPQGEVIQFARLDNPSQVVVNFDGAMAERSSGDGGSTGNASMLFLRQLNEAIEFPKGMFANPKQATLTVVTNGGGKTNLYRFRLVLAGGTPPHSIVQLIAAPAPAPAQLVSVSQEYQNTVLRQLSQGLAYAESKKMIDTSSQSYAQVKTLIALMQSGTPFAQALPQSGAPSRLVDQLRSYASSTNR